MKSHKKLKSSFVEDQFVDDKNKLIASFFNIKYFIWIDSQNNYDNNNSKIFKKLQKNLFLNESDCFVFFDIQNDFLNFINQNDFKFNIILIIINDDFIEEYLNILNENLSKIIFIPISIIFTDLKKYNSLINKKINNFELKSNDFYLKQKNIYYNIIYLSYDYQTLFNIIMNFNIQFNKELSTKNSNFLTKKNDYEGKFIFEYIDSKYILILPSILGKLNEISKLNENEVNNFNEFLYEKHYNMNIKYLILPLLKIINTPNEIVSKIWASAYTIECKFYKDLNLSLLNNEESIYQTYIKMMYYGIETDSLISNINCDLFRASLINVDEVKIIHEYLKKKRKNLPSSICYSKTFLSFSKMESIARSFLKKSYNNTMTSAFFIVKKLNLNDYENEIKNYYASNADLENLSFFYEEEVLFFPFSAFTIEDIYEENYNGYNVTYIILNYLGKYKEIIDEIIEEEPKIVMENINKIIKEEKSEFAKNFINQPHIKKIENIEDKIEEKMEEIKIEIKEEKNNKNNKKLKSKKKIIKKIFSIDNLILHKKIDKKCNFLLLLKDNRILCCINQLDLLILNENFDVDLIIKEHFFPINFITQISDEKIITCSNGISIFKINNKNFEIIQRIFDCGISYKIIELENKNLLFNSKEKNLFLFSKEKYSEKYEKISNFKTSDFIIYDFIETKNNEICYSNFNERKIYFYDLNKNENISFKNINIFGWNNKLYKINKDNLIICGKNSFYIYNILNNSFSFKLNLDFDITSLFITNENQFISGDNKGNLILWNFDDYKQEKIEKINEKKDKKIEFIQSLIFNNNYLIFSDNNNIFIYK
jgi:hypothetical protein